MIIITKPYLTALGNYSPGEILSPTLLGAVPKDCYRILVGREEVIDALLTGELALCSGAHSTPDRGMCVMEAASYIAGEPFSDRPHCVNPYLGSCLRAWNDSLPNRKGLERLLPVIVGTWDMSAAVYRDLLRNYYAEVYRPAGAGNAVKQEHRAISGQLYFDSQYREKLSCLLPAEEVKNQVIQILIDSIQEWKNAKA